MPVKVSEVLFDHQHCSNGNHNSINSRGGAAAASLTSTTSKQQQQHWQQQQGQVATNLKIPSVSRPWLPASFLKQVE